MLRVSLAIVGATLLVSAALGSSSAGRSGGIPKTAISTEAPVLRLAADGTTVVAVVGSPKTRCAAQTLIWDVRRGTPVVMRGKGESTTSRFCPPYKGDPDLAVAVGGGMVGVLRFVHFESGDHYLESVLSITRLPTNGRWTAITAVVDYEYGAGEGDYLSLLGDGTILAFNKWTVCFVYDVGITCPGVNGEAEWWVSSGQLVEVRRPGSKGALPCPRLAGGWTALAPQHPSRVNACRKVGSGAGFVGATALDRGRFLTLPPKGQVTIIRASDGSVTRLPIPTSTVRQADLDGGNLLVLRRESPGMFVLDVRDASTGALRHTWQLTDAPVEASTIHLEAAHSGIAVYRIGTTIHLLRVTDGKSHAIVIPGNQGPVHARLEDPGLIYSYRLPGTRPRGRVEFVPFAHLRAKLR